MERGSSGIYTCQASNSEGSTTHATQLLVLGALCGEGPELGHPCGRPDLWLGVHVWNLEETYAWGQGHEESEGAPNTGCFKISILNFKKICKQTNRHLVQSDAE